MKYMITCRMLTGLILWSLFGFSTASLAGKWEEKANLPTPRWGLATAVVNGKIYAIGGQDNTPDVNKVEVYDPKRDTWDVINSVPTGRIWLAASVVKGKIYVIGGTKDNLTALAAMEEYDPKTKPVDKESGHANAENGTSHRRSGREDLCHWRGDRFILSVWGGRGLSSGDGHLGTETGYAKTEMGDSRCRAAVKDLCLWRSGGSLP